MIECILKLGAIVSKPPLCIIRSNGINYYQVNKSGNRWPVESNGRNSNGSDNYARKTGLEMEESNRLKI